MHTWDQFMTVVADTVDEVARLKETHAPGLKGHVSYCAIFCQDDSEFENLDRLMSEHGVLADETPTGPVYAFSGLETSAGRLRIVKVRRPDLTRPERGDADFALDDYESFKQRVLDEPGFSLIVRDEFEMIELVDSKFPVRAYFSHPPVELHRGLPDALAKLDDAR